MTALQRDWGSQDSPGPEAVQPLLAAHFSELLSVFKRQAKAMDSHQHDPGHRIHLLCERPAS